jgi:ParB family chromosome partitioning protein
MTQPQVKKTLTVVSSTFVAQGERKDIPWAKLFVSPYNVRKTTPTQIEQLAALIESQGGVIENLIVYAEIKNGKATGNYGVAGGGRRYRAVEQLVKQNKFSKNHPMPSLIVPEDKAVELSIVENSGDEPMHPADEFDAFKALIEGGKEVKDVAAIFGITENTVYRRLRLANVAPTFIEEFRNNQINIGVLEALALTTDHDLQLRVWDGLQTYERQPRNIRAAIMADNINISTNSLGRFVGVDAFESAGGHIERDLFSDRGDGYISDMPLLARLAEEKLAAAALPFQESGDWAWVEIVQELDYQAICRYGRAQMVERIATPEELTHISSMETRAEEIDAQIEVLEETDEDFSNSAEYKALDEQRDALSAEISNAKNVLLVLSPEHKALAGVLVGIGEAGQLRIEVGRIKPEDKKTASNNVTGDVQQSKQVHSERLIRQLTAQRTVALQEAVAGNPRVAMVALAVQLFIKTFRIGYNPTGLTVSTTSAALDMNGGEIIKSDRAYVLMNERCAAWETRLVGDGSTDQAEIYSRVAALAEEDLYTLLALCTALSVDTISGSEYRPAMANLLMVETGLDMADWWKPTADSYFGSVSKTRILGVVSQVVPPDTLGLMNNMKKGQLAVAAETAMRDQRYLPAELMIA